MLMALYDTTNVLKSTMLLKANLAKNGSKNNEYLYDAQARRDADWYYRDNVMDIEEELQKPLMYDPQCPIWSWTESVANTVYSDSGARLSTDWQELTFKDLRHPTGVGYRYRFSSDFYRYAHVSPDDRAEIGSVWIGINFSPMINTNSIIVRRCQSTIAFGGVHSLHINSTDESDYDKYLEVHYEPVIIESQMTSDFRAINKYSNEVVSLPQAELYLVMQANYYTRFIGINDRIIVGNTYGESSSVLSRNFTQVFEVKAIKEATSTRTYDTNNVMNVNYIPLIYVALDKTLESPDDNMSTRLAHRCPVYLVPQASNIPTASYGLVFNDYGTNLVLGSSEAITCQLYNNGTVVDDVDYSGCTFTTTGATSSYRYTANANTLTLYNLKKSNTPVVITASLTYNGVEYVTDTTASVVLGGIT